MTKSEAFCPDWTTSPGDTIRDILEERELSVFEFANRMLLPIDHTEDLLEGRMTITLALARRLHKVLGASIEFWVSRDFDYRQDFARLNAAHHNWLTQFPISDMIRFGWIEAPHPSDELAACLRFFNVPSVAMWNDIYGRLQYNAAFRTSPTLESHPGAVAAWLRQGEVEAAIVRCERWTSDKFRMALTDIRKLTREKEPRKFIPSLRAICAECGVAVVIVRAPSGCRASGAARFTSPTQALIQLSGRFLTDDHFWFTFFHEAGHLILHGNAELFLDGIDDTLTSPEREANEFAATTLVPPEFQTQMMKLRRDGRELMRFARRVGVSPGIIVGQLQYLGRLKPNQLSNLKRRFDWTGLELVSRGIS